MMPRDGVAQEADAAVNSARVRERLSEWIAQRIEVAAPIAAVALLVVNGLGFLWGTGKSTVFSAASMVWQSVLLLIEAWIMRRPSIRRYAREVGLIVASLVFASMVLDGWVQGEPTTSALLLAAFVLVTPAVLPWGWKSQLAFAAMGTVAFLATLALTVGVSTGLSTPWGSAIIVAAVASLGIAMQLEAVHTAAIEHALRQERERALYQELVDRAVEAILRTDINGSIQFANDAAARLFAVDRQELLGQRFFDFVAIPTREEVVRFFAEQYRGNDDRALRETPIVDAKGNRKWASLTVRTLRRGSQRDGFHIVARDITERVRIVEQLRQSEVRFRSTFERAPIGIALVATDGRFLQVNGALCQMLGYSAQELCQRDFQSITFPADLAADLALVGECLQGLRDTYEMEKRYVRRDGKLVTARLLVGLVRDSHGIPVYFVSLIEDITERRRLERELAQAKEAAEAANRAKTMFLARMSHEIRTPLTGVLGMLDLLRSSALTAEQLEYVETAKSSGETLLALLNDLLELSRIESGRIDFQVDTVDSHRLIHDVCRAFRAQAETKGLGFELAVAANVPQFVRIDPKVLRQILVNLVGNAVKFTTQGCVGVEVQWQASDDEHAGTLCLVVRDTGPGIAPGEFEHLFEPFAQGSAGRRTGGSGLGLAIVRRFAEACGGGAWVESEWGVGSTFHVRLPLEVAAPRQPSQQTSAAVAEEPVPAGARKRRSRRVLVAEDHPVNQMLLRRLLEKGGYEVRLAGDGNAALACLEVERFDALLLDVQMPGVDGLELTKIVREREARGECFSRSGGTVPIVVLTAHAWAEDRERCLQAGANAYLAKPVHAAVLYASLNQCLPAEQEMEGEPARVA
ncbi:MAG: PAS domain S-box protein [Candidatus Binatia bacterium]|nr:PAS domain S-box protein [Candidatus Binatia bacterium]